MTDWVSAALHALPPDREDGQSMVEYSLILALVAIAAIAGLVVLGPKLATFFASLAGAFSGPANPGV